MQNKIYKAMTRKALVLGIPMIPLVLINALLIIISYYFSILLLLLIFPISLLMFIASKKDEAIFDNYFNKLKALTKDQSVTQIINSIKTHKTLAIEPMQYNISSSKTKALFNGNLISINTYIPYLYHLNDFIILTKDSDLVATIQINSGVNYFTAPDDIIQSENDYIHNLIKNLSINYENILIHVNKIFDTKEISLNNEFSNKYANKINELYFKNNTYNYSDTYISLVLIKGNNQLDEFRNIVEHFCSGLKKYDAKILKLNNDNFLNSEAVNFYNKLLLNNDYKIRLGKFNICDLLGDKRVYIGKNTIQLHGIDDLFCKAVEIKEFSEYSIAGFYDGLASLGLKLNVTQIFTPLSRFKSLSKIEAQRKKFISAEDKAVSQQDDLYHLDDELSGGKIALGTYSITILVFNDNQSNLKKDLNKLLNFLSGLGIVSINSNVNLLCNFFSQLPANHRYRTRLSRITSRNFTDFISIHKNYQGSKNNNAWGEAVSIFKLKNNQAYFLNLHETNKAGNYGQMALGHTHINGSSGAGKSMLLSFIFNQLQKYNGTYFYLDKDYSSEANIKALGGQYISIKSGEPTGFNLFSLEKSEENVQFVFNILKTLVTKTEKSFTALQSDELRNAINNVFNLPKDKRNYGISRIFENLKKSKTEDKINLDLSTRLKEWSRAGKFGWVFDNEHDNFNFNDNTNFGIDGTEFLADKYTSDVISYYILHRITQLLDGRRLVLFIDEFWQWLNSDIFSDFVKDKLKTIRKLNGIIITATQSPSDVIASPIASAVIEQCETKIFLANPEAKYNEYVENKEHISFGLNAKEFNILKSFNKSDRLGLVKKSDGVAIIKLDFSSLGTYAKLLSCDAIAHNKIAKIQYSNSDEFINKFLN